jgi:hypothetical protein
MIFLKIFLLFFEGVNSSSGSVNKYSIEKNECERDCQQRLIIKIPDGLVLTMKRHLVGKENETIYTFGNYLLKFHEKKQRWFLMEKHEKIRRVHCFSKRVSNLSLEKDGVFKCLKAKRPILSKIIDIVCSECKPAIELDNQCDLQTTVTVGTSNLEEYHQTESDIFIKFNGDDSKESKWLTLPNSGGTFSSDLERKFILDEDFTDLGYFLYK